MEIDFFDKFIEEARELSPEYIHLQRRGEPLMHPNFDKFVKKSLEVTKAVITIIDGYKPITDVVTTEFAFVSRFSSACL